MNNPKSHHPEFDAEDARQGYVVLRSTRRRTIFIAGLVGFVILAILLN